MIRSTFLLLTQFCLFHSLASNLQLTFTGFFHKAGESFSVFVHAWVLTFRGNFDLLFFQGNYLRTVRMSRTLCLWRFCWSKFVTRRGRCVGYLGIAGVNIFMIYFCFFKIS